MIHRSRNTPRAVGANRTRSILFVWGGMTVPSASVVVAANRLATGGFDLRIVNGVPPALPTVKLRVTDRPTATAPNWSAVGVIVICAGGAAAPLTGTRT